MKDGDIYKWRYNNQELEKKNHKNNGGTTYWCCSCIGIWNNERNLLVDTYWGGGGNRSFTNEDIEEKLILIFVANMGDLKPCQKWEFNNYDDADCVDISHANMMRGGFYIKREAKPSIKKKRRVLEAHIEHTKHKIKYHKSELSRLKDDLMGLTADSYVPYNKDIFIPAQQEG